MSVPLSSEPAFPKRVGESDWSVIVDTITREVMNGGKEKMVRALDVLCPANIQISVLYALRAAGINPDFPSS